MSILNRAARIAALFLLVATLTTCGDSEPDQRKAFIKFLQEVNNRSGVHFLIPKPEEEKAFGPYAAHYAIILDYSKAMEVASQEFADHIKKLGVGPASKPRTIEQMAAAPNDLVVAKQEVEKIDQAAEARLAKINADRSVLKQPDDLKAVYDKTFDKLITAPTLAFEKSNKAPDEGLDVSIKLVDYVNSHRSKLTISGAQIQAKDQRTLDEISALLKAHEAAGERFAAAQRDGDRVLRGD
jgi:hypothetical protein